MVIVFARPAMHYVPLLTVISLTISAKPVGVGAASQARIPTGERSLSRTHIAMTESVSFVRANEKLTAFVELESAIPAVTS